MLQEHARDIAESCIRILTTRLLSRHSNWEPYSGACTRVHGKLSASLKVTGVGHACRRCTFVRSFAANMAVTHRLCLKVTAVTHACLRCTRNPKLSGHTWPLSSLRVTVVPSYVPSPLTWRSHTASVLR